MSLVLSGENLINTAKGHMRSTCWKVNNLARYPAQYSLSRKVTHDLDLQLAPVASDGMKFPHFIENCDFSYSYHSYYIYPHYPHKLIRAYLEKNPKKSFYNTPTSLEREVLILREKSL